MVPKTVPSTAQNFFGTNHLPFESFQIINFTSSFWFPVVGGTSGSGRREERWSAESVRSVFLSKRDDSPCWWTLGARSSGAPSLGDVTVVFDRGDVEDELMIELRACTR